MKMLNGYQFTPRLIEVYPEIWDAEKKQLIAIKDMDATSIHEVLDSIVLAVDAGVIDSYLWPQQIFANRTAFESFIEQLSEYDECYRITDQWWQALSDLIDYCDEEGFVSSSEISDRIFEAAVEDGKLENFGRKEPKYKFSVKECIDAALECATDDGTGYPPCFFTSAAERSRVRGIAQFGRHHSEQPTKTQLRAAYREGELFLKAHLAAEKVAAKVVKIKRAASKAALKVKAAVKK